METYTTWNARAEKPLQAAAKLMQQNTPHISQVQLKTSKQKCGSIWRIINEQWARISDLKERLLWCYDSILIRARNNAHLSTHNTHTIYNCRHARTAYTFDIMVKRKYRNHCVSCTSFSRDSQLRPTIAVASFFTHTYFNYNIQSNGFICERFTLKFWFVSINCMVCCCACRALLMR